MYKTLRSFKFAFRGIQDAFKSEPNLRIHTLFALATITMAFLLEFNSTEFSILVLSISSVITLELANTSIEKLVDLNSTEISEKARIIKDISAGFVFLSSVAAIIIGLILFTPKLFF